MFVSLVNFWFNHYSWIFTDFVTEPKKGVGVPNRAGLLVYSYHY